MSDLKVVDGMMKDDHATALTKEISGMEIEMVSECKGSSLARNIVLR